MRAEFGHLVSGCGLFDLGTRAKVAVTGGDRVRWLNGMVTNNVRDLVPSHGVYAFLLNPQGHILGDLYAYNRGESLLIDTDQAQLEKTLATFDRYIIMDDVEVTNLSDKMTAIGVAGPKAGETLRAAGFEAVQLAPLQFVDLSWQNRAMTLARGDNPAVEWYELWCAPGEVAALHDGLKQAGARLAGGSAVDLLRIASGVPRYGTDIRERDLPQETEQERALNFNKGCYIGQEIVERIRSRGAVHRKFSGFEVRGPLPEPGTKIQVDGKDIGEITSAAALPLSEGERNVALGYIRREMAAPGKELRAGDAQLTVATLPFTHVFPSRND
ncbi:MAG: folate-binding protein [Acidobacteriia bacterium]|nr:folate-binding protein [Terriglobia bacterium]